MNAPLFIALALAGGLGAVLRFVVDGAVRARWPGAFPWGTALINVSGSFVLGWLTGLGASGGLTHEWVLVIGTGAMGGYTTFSTASLETVRLAQDRRYGLALLNGFGVLLLALAAAWAGALLGRHHLEPRPFPGSGLGEWSFPAPPATTGAYLEYRAARPPPGLGTRRSLLVSEVHGGCVGGRGDRLGAAQC